jgi:hypothetical protein
MWSIVLVSKLVTTYNKEDEAGPPRISANYSDSSTKL